MHVLLFILFVVPSDCYKILALLPYPGKSHYMVFEPILEELTKRGHHLTVVSFFPSDKPEPNRRDVSLAHLASLNVEVIDLKDLDRSYFGLERYFEHIPLVTALAKSCLKLCEKIINSEVFEEFVRGEGDYDVILVEHFNSDCMLGIVHNYGLPSVGLMSSAILPWTPSRVGAPDNPAYVPGMTLPFTEEMNFYERLENTLVLLFYNTWYEWAIWREEQRILERRLGRKLPLLSDVGRNTSVVLVNTHYSINGVRVLPPSIVEIGGVHLHNRDVQPLTEPLDELVSAAKNGFILFSLGSLIRGSSLPKKRFDAIVKAFARMPQLILWKWEADPVEDLPDNILMLKWLPQYDLLNHPNCMAFVTHGGLLSLTEAVAAGVPSLIIPILGDQFGNAAHAQRAGVAEVLPFKDIEEESMFEALNKVLFWQKRQYARLLREVWRDRPHQPMETAIFHIERTARFGGVEMSSHGRWLTRYQLAGLDLITFVISIVVCVVYVFKCVCSKKLKKKQC
ncbi:UDP-glucosyltransferase 2 [Manduca sexta]|uniref:UDP-glycosyltransferase n=1 Tax=Manduca sexta TaxID=7130 RepID=A0A921ZCL3_MANSE|nr:UDP-glucosyltransferase 2 [Manduca sexta]KAG6455502.1 UDP-glycosyltransferase [Manduca sexta]